MLNEEVDKLTKLAPDRRKNDRRRLDTVPELADINSIRNLDQNKPSIGAWLFTVSFIVPWMMGIVLAYGPWLKVLAIFFIPYAWYLTAEKLMALNGLL